MTGENGWLAGITPSPEPPIRSEGQSGRASAGALQRGAIRDPIVINGATCPRFQRYQFRLTSGPSQTLMQRTLIMRNLLMLTAAGSALALATGSLNGATLVPNPENTGLAGLVQEVQKG